MDGKNDSDEEELELKVDPSGRVACEGNEKLDYSFRSFANVFAGGVPDSLRNDCQTVFTARDAGKGKYSAGDTFWVPASADKTQLSQLELVALQLFKYHTRPAEGLFDPSTSGAEWWTQCVRPIDDIGFHWDRDYSLEDNGIALHPLVGTVTYLGDVGGPTVLANKISSNSLEESVVGPITNTSAFMISRPRTGKHMCFDGRLLHAAPGRLAKLWDGPTTGTRMTLLMNVWLNWKPGDAEPLSSELRAKLQPANVEQKLTFEPKQPTELKVGPDVVLTEDSFKFKADVPVRLHASLPVAELKEFFSSAHEPFSVALSFEGPDRKSVV